MYYVYILRSLKDHHFYTGFTNDLRKRLQQHNAGLTFSIKSRVPFILVYYEACIDKKDAVAREKYLKTGMGKRYIKNRIKRYLTQ